MELLHLAIAFVIFLAVALYTRRLGAILLAGVIFGLVSFMAIWSFGFISHYSSGLRTGVVQKYSVKGIVVKSHEIIVLLPIEGMVMNETPSNVLTISCVPRKTPTACEAFKSALATRRKIVFEYNQWLVKPATQDSNYTVEKVLGYAPEHEGEPLEPIENNLSEPNNESPDSTNPAKQGDNQSEIDNPTHNAENPLPQPTENKTEPNLPNLQLLSPNNRDSSI